MTPERLKEVISTYPSGMKFSLRVGMSRHSRNICLLLVPEYGSRTVPVYVPRRQQQDRMTELQVQQINKQCHQQKKKYFGMLDALGCLLTTEGNLP